MQRRRRYDLRSLSYIIFSIILFCFIILKLYSSTKAEQPQSIRIRSQIPSRPAARSLNITIVIVISKKSDINEYSYPMNTVRCYAKMHNYNLVVVRDDEYMKKCPQKDEMFRRHCIVAEILQTTSWVLFIDADIAVVNPNRLIEEFVDTNYDVTLYDRVCSWEIAAGSYLVRNTTWAQKWLRSFANFETKLPSNSFHGTDNGALHAFILEYLQPELLEEAEICYRIWKKSNGYATLFLYEACMRAVMGQTRKLQKMRILKKGTGWVRDIWLTNSQWNEERDFMLHGLKTSDRSEIPDNILEWIGSQVRSRFTWYAPTKPLDLEECGRGRVTWEYDERLRVSRQVIDKKLNEISHRVEREQWSILSNVYRYL